MLSADSTTLKNPSAAQIRAIPPTMPSSAALAWMSSTTVTSLSTELAGKARWSCSIR